jgi:TetR/AcrR family transcriptional regulator, cholesterol catabolism regulator
MTEQAVRRNRRDEVVRTAVQMFAAEGYEGVTIQDIADVSGVLKGNVYYYFPAKVDLLFEIIDDLHSRFLDAIAGWVAEPAAPGDRLAHVLECHVGQMFDRLDQTVVAYHDFRRLPPDRKAVIVAKRDVYEGIIRSLVSQCQAAGEMCPDLDLDLATKAILGMSNWIYQWGRVGDRVAPGTIARTFASMAVAGLVPCAREGHVHPARS